MVDRGTVLAFCVTSPCVGPQDGLQWEHCDIVGGHQYETHGSVSAFGVPFRCERVTAFDVRL